MTRDSLPHLAETAPTASEERLRSVPWCALDGLGPALEVPLAAVLSGVAAERALDGFLRAHRALGPEARAAAAEAVFGVAVWRRRLAWHLGAERDALGGAPSSPSPRALLGALVRDLGGVADAESLVGLPPGALPPTGAPPEPLELRFSFPDWLAETLRREAGDEAWSLADALDAPGPVAFRPNLLRTRAGPLAERLAREGVATRPGLLAPGALVVTSARPNVYGLGAYRDGLFEVQDEASQLAGLLVGARQGDTVLDACAGAGGKALLLAAAVGDEGVVHAADADARRLDRLSVRARRAGAEGIVRVHRAPLPDALEVDAALVDAPCSELGALRRGPDLRFRLDPGSLAALPALQGDILRRAARHVRPGGRLAYVTCTFRREENDEVALAFEREHAAFEREPAALPGTAGPAPSGLVGPDGFVRTWPHRHGCDGFFVALFRRRASPARRAPPAPRPL